MKPYQQLEKEYAEFAGSKYAVTCNSGTSGLHLALLALKIGEGDEVIVPDFAMAACAFSVSYTGAKPVFVDVDADTYALDSSKIEEAITKRTKAIMAVHTYGRLANMQAIAKIAKKHKLFIIEDASEAHGAVYKSKADAVVYSFYSNKIISSEEGGIVTVNNKRLADRINYLKCMAFDKAHSYFHADIGYNYRMSNCNANLALKSLRSYSKHAKRRREIEALYNEILPMRKRDAVWFYEVFVPEKARRSILKKIPAARTAFQPLSSFPMYGNKKLRSTAAKLARSLVLLPVSFDMTDNNVRRVARIVRSCIEQVT